MNRATFKIDRNDAEDIQLIIDQGYDAFYAFTKKHGYSDELPKFYSPRITNADHTAVVLKFDSFNRYMVIEFQDGYGQTVAHEKYRNVLGNHSITYKGNSYNIIIEK